MPIERGNVPGLPDPPGYTHYAVVSEARLVFLAGLVPLDEAGEVVAPGDPLAQAEQCLANLRATLSAVGATAADAVRTVVYVVALEQSQMGEVWRRILHSDVGDICRTAATLLGVATLGYTGQVVEIDVTLALPPERDAPVVAPNER